MCGLRIEMTEPPEFMMRLGEKLDSSRKVLPSCVPGSNLSEAATGTSSNRSPLQAGLHTAIAAAEVRLTKQLKKK